MSILEVFVVGMTFGSIIGGMSVQWANDRVELHKLRDAKTYNKVISGTHTKQVKRKQLEYKGEI